MALLNYSTTIDAAKTVGEIQALLAKHGAKAVLSEYNDGGIKALSFMMEKPDGDVSFRLPANVEAVHRLIQRQYRERKIKDRRHTTYEQAVKVAWRVLKDWIEAQLAIVETEMVAMEEVFLPYAITRGGKTLYESLAESKFKLLEAKSGE